MKEVQRDPSSIKNLSSTQTSNIENDDKLVKLEHLALDCLYPHLKRESSGHSPGHKPGMGTRHRLVNEFTNYELERYFGIRKEFKKECPEILQDYSSIAAAQSAQNLIFPTYGDVLKDVIIPVKPIKYGNNQFKIPFQTKLSSKRIRSQTVDPQKIEESIRKESLRKKQATCESEEMLNDLIQSNKIYDHLAWKEILHYKGYDCASSIYGKLSQALNEKKEHRFAQEEFDNLIESLKNPNELSHNTFKTKLNKVLSPNHMIILFPNLGYDIPSDLPREKLTLTEWKKKNFYSPSLKQRFVSGYNIQGKKIDPYGIRFEMIERVTVEDAASQIKESEKKFIEILNRELKSNPDTRFIILGRSMGALVAREVLQKNKNTLVNNKLVPSVIESVIFMGGTPYGSVIADYKARFDSHDETYKMMTDFKASVAKLFLDLQSFFTGNQSHFKQLIEAGRERENIKSMSFRNFDSSLIEKNTGSPYKVVNLIYLRPRINDYFANSKLSENADFVFLQWAMYGPTEGSSPLSHAAWDTSDSVRIFLSTHNHLAGWNLTSEENINLLIKTLELTSEIGFIEK